jgi:GGDEF domain-containing protein
VGANNKHLPSAVDDERDLLNIARVLLQGIGIHSPKEDVNDHRQFCAKLQETSDYLVVSPSPQARLLQAESALHMLRDYNLRAAKRQRVKEAELGAIIQLLLATLEDLSIARPERMQQLKEIAEKLKSAKGAEDLRMGKASLSDCLAEVRKEAERQLTGAQGDRDRDLVTNLENRAAAETALVQACASEDPLCAVILAVDRIALYNQRYGREVGDKVLRFFADHVKRSFVPGGLLYRWTGPAMLILRSGPFDKVNPEVRAILETKVQYECETGSRTVLLSVDASWSVFPMMVDPRLLINKIDGFVA